MVQHLVAHCRLTLHLRSSFSGEHIVIPHITDNTAPRICAFKDDSTSGYAHTWDYSYPYGNSNLNLVSSWGSDSLTLSGSGPGVWGWNENDGETYNYIAV